jgi:hypothetical protein
VDHQRLEWERLIQSLDDWGSAREGEPGRIHVRLPDGSREVTIVMTPEEWSEDMTGVMWGNFEDALNDVKETLLNLGINERFARYSQYRLYGSEDAMTALADDEDHAAEPGGEWSTVDRGGHISRFADGPKPDQLEQ